MPPVMWGQELAAPLCTAPRVVDHLAGGTPHYSRGANGQVPGECHCAGGQAAGPRDSWVPGAGAVTSWP